MHKIRLWNLGLRAGLENMSKYLGEDVTRGGLVLNAPEYK